MRPARKKFGDPSLDVFPVRSHFRGLPETDPLLAEVPRMGDFAADFLQKQQTQGEGAPQPGVRLQKPCRCRRRPAMKHDRAMALLAANFAANAARDRGPPRCLHHHPASLG